MGDNSYILPYRKTRIGKYTKKFQNRSLELRKLIYQMTHNLSYSDRRYVFIFGSQRSGTTLLGLVFNKDMRSAVLQEINCLTGTNERHLRLKPYSEVRRNLDKIRAPLIVIKPLVESYRAPEILKEIPQSKGIWMFRQYRDVVGSTIQRFSSQVQGLKMTITGDPPSWRSEGVSNETREILKEFYHDDMNPADAAALGWYSINTLFFQLQLNNNPRIILCNYEDFCKTPEVVMKNLYSFIDIQYSKWDITREVDKKSLSLGKDVNINKEIESLCAELHDRILKKYNRHK